MITPIPNLSYHSQKCLDLFLSRFPQFDSLVIPSNIFDNLWSAELPWPNGWNSVGLIAQTWKSDWNSPYGEEFRVDLGNSHDHFADYSRSGTFDYLNDAFEIIEDILSERYVLIAIWIHPEEYYSHIRPVNYQPTEDDWANDVHEIWRRSWHGSFDHEWHRAKP